MNCIIISFFNNFANVKYALLLLESLFIFGNINDNIEIIIHTSNKFKQKIIEGFLYNPKIKFELDDDNSNIQLFDLSFIKKYEKILHIDPKTLILNDINNLFNLEIDNNVIYSINDCNINLFKNNITIDSLVNKEILGNYVSIDNHDDNDDKKIIFKSVNTNIYKFFINKKDVYINKYINNCRDYINLVMNNDNNENVFRCENKCKNIVNILINKNIKNVLITDENFSFKIILMLISNPNIKITYIVKNITNNDNYKKILICFPDRLNVIIGDSSDIMPTLKNKFDIIDINNSENFAIVNDIVNSYHLSNNKAILIMNNYDNSMLNNLWNVYCIKYKLKEIDINIYESSLHNIKFISKS